MLAFRIEVLIIKASLLSQKKDKAYIEFMSNHTSDLMLSLCHYQKSDHYSLCSNYFFLLLLKSMSRSSTLRLYVEISSTLMLACMSASMSKITSKFMSKLISNLMLNSTLICMLKTVSKIMLKIILKITLRNLH